MHKSARHQLSDSCRCNRHLSSPSCSTKHRDTQESHSKSSSNSSVTVCCNCHRKHHHHKCSHRKGELVINGGFENLPNPFLHWIINSGVDPIDPGMGDTPHLGLNAARLGFVEPFAFIYQDIPGICPGRFYQLDFFMSTAKDLCNASVNVRLEFLDKHKIPLGNPALDILVPQNSLYETYSAFIEATYWPAPHRANFARVSFATDTGADADGYVTLDDVSLVALVGKVHV